MRGTSVCPDAAWRGILLIERPAEMPVGSWGAGDAG